MGRKIAKHKWIVMAVLIVALVVFDTLVYNVSLTNRSIAVGISIDLENDEIELTAQIVVPKNGGISSGGNNYVTFSNKGKDINEIMDKINAELGSELSLAHIVTIILGKSVIETNRYDLIEYFLSDAQVTDNTLVVMAQDKGKDILSAKVPVGEVASYQIQQIVKPIRPPSGIPSATLQTIALNLNQFESVAYMPIVKKEKTEPSSDQSKEGEKEAELLKIDQAIIFNRAGDVLELDKKQTEGLTYALTTIRDGSVAIKGRDGKDVSVEIIESNGGIKVDLEKMSADITLNLKTIRGAGIKEDNSSITYQLNQAEQDELEKALSDRVMGCYNYALEKQMDVFNVKQLFYEKYGNKFLNLNNEDFLKQLSVTIKFKIEQR